MSVQVFNTFVATLALMALVATAFLAVTPSLREAVSARAAWGAAIVALIATLGSLTYSEYFLFEPCRLCWFQRIAMYPLVPVIAVGAWRRDPSLRWYALPLAVIGAGISVYHYLIQTFPALSGENSCVVGASCSAKYVNAFGFVSIPFMAGCGFLLIIALTQIARFKEST